MVRVFFVFLIAGLLVAGCGAGEEIQEEEEELPDPEQVFSALGTVHYVDLEGGFYGIVTDDSLYYNPTNLGSTYQQDGLRVHFRAQEIDSLMTIHMWGRPIEIIDIMEVDY